MAGLVLTASASSASPKRAAASPIVVCEIAANSGPFARLGTSDELGALAWATTVNASGGLLGHQIRLVLEDDQSNPATAASLVRKCVLQDKSNFIFGPEQTSTSSAAIPIANSLHQVLLGWQAGWETLSVSKSALHGYAFPAIGNAYYANDKGFVQSIIVPRHYKRVAVMQDNVPIGNNAAYAASLGKTKGFRVVASQVVTPGATNDTPAVLNLLAAHPQAILLALIPGSDTITAIKAIRAQDPTIPIGGCALCSQPSFISAAGGASGMADVYLTGPPQFVLSLPRTPTTRPAIIATRAYLKAMRAAGLSTTDDLNGGQNGWDSGVELEAAIKAARSIKAAAVRTALQHQVITVGGAWNYTFHRTPLNYGNMPITVQSIATVDPNGELVLANR